jgi:hypothetical protein
VSHQSDLYHRDYNAWAAEQRALVRAGRTEDIDAGDRRQEPA